LATSFDAPLQELIVVPGVSQVLVVQALDGRKHPEQIPVPAQQPIRILGVCNVCKKESHRKEKDAQVLLHNVRIYSILIGSLRFF
jgi:hypothetical protein